MQLTRHHFTLQSQIYLRDEVKRDPVSTTCFLMSVIQDTSLFGLRRKKDGRPISMSAVMRERVTMYYTMFSLQVCFLLCEKSIRQSPPPGACITFRGSRSPCTIPIL